MKVVDLYARVRRACHAEGMSQREAARIFGIDPKTVAKMLRFSVPPGYRRSKPPVRPKLDPLLPVIDRILEEDQGRPRKQRHTARRIFERLKAEHGFTGGETIVKDYVRERRLRGQEMFVPLVHPPGHGQADFGEAVAVIGGVEQRIHFLAVDLPHSDACFVRAYPAETTEAFCDGHNAAFAFFGRVPQSMLYDNTKLAVARILGDGTRQRTRTFAELQSHYLFADRFGRPGKGNDKGKVEGLVGYARRNFLVPVPQVESLTALNSHLETRCRERQHARLRGHEESIGERLTRDLAAMLPLPSTPYEACERRSARVSSLSLVRYRGNDYSVPVAYGHREVLVRGYVETVVIGCGAAVIARHRRSYEREDVLLEPLHYLPLLERKIAALDQAAPLAGWELPDAFLVLRRLLEARLGKAGRREWVQVLRLLEVFSLDEVQVGVSEALRLGAIGFDAVKHLVLCRVERRPPRLDLEVYPYLPGLTWPCWARTGHERRATRVACPSSQGAQAADLSARARQVGAAVRGRRCRSSPLPPASGRVGAD
jgi:transposase